jgi:hypothetical protein
MYKNYVVLLFESVQLTDQLASCAGIHYVYKLVRNRVRVSGNDTARKRYRVADLCHRLAHGTPLDGTRYLRR